MIHKLDSPLRIKKGKKTHWSLNLNIYRNTHYTSLNRHKKTYTKMMKEAISKLPFFMCINITYTVYPRDKRIFDIGNVCSITDKFFLDALVHYGKIEDDSYLFVPEIHFKYGHIDEHNPRVEILIKELKEKQMITTAIKLQEEDIKEAITVHLLANGYVPEGKEVHIVLESSDEGIEASVELTNSKKKVTRKRSTIKKTTDRPPETEPLEELTVVEEVTEFTEDDNDGEKVSEEDGLFD